MKNVRFWFAGAIVTLVVGGGYFVAVDAVERPPQQVFSLMHEKNGQ